MQSLKKYPSSYIDNCYLGQYSFRCFVCDLTIYRNIYFFLSVYIKKVSKYEFCISVYFHILWIIVLIRMAKVFRLLSLRLYLFFSFYSLLQIQRPFWTKHCAFWHKYNSWMLRNTQKTQSSLRYNVPIHNNKSRP